MRRRASWLWMVLFVMPMVTMGVGCQNPQGSTAQEQRDSILQMRDDTLNRLYAANPEARDHVENAPGFGAFSNVQTSVIFVTTGNGYGVVTDNHTGDETFMRVGKFGGGLGLGVQSFNAIFVFNKADAMNSFVSSGWEWGTSGDAAVASNTGGASAAGAASFDSDITIYRLTDSGIVAQVSIAGTKYSLDKKLNADQ